MVDFGFSVFGHQNNLDRLERDPKVVVISYNMLNRLQQSMLEKRWEVMIIDESHNIRCTKKTSESGEVSWLQKALNFPILSHSCISIIFKFLKFLKLCTLTTMCSCIMLPNGVLAFV